MANLIKKDTNSKIRKTISYARYLMCVHLGRLLTDDEEVDHKDNNKLNDDINNLQVLSSIDNKQKQALFKWSGHNTKIVLNCSFCGNEFEYASKNYTYYIKSGRTKFNCSKECAYSSYRKN